MHGIQKYLPLNIKHIEKMTMARSKALIRTPTPAITPTNRPEAKNIKE